jgi:hypothetical protein
MIDALFDLELLCAEPENIKPMLLATSSGIVKVGESLLANAASLDPEDRKEIASRVADAKLAVDELRRRGAQPLRMEDKLKKITKNPRTLLTYYLRYCSSAHNDLKALSDRHIRGKTIVLGETLPDAEAIELLTISILCAFHVFEFVPTFLTVSAEQLQPEWEPLLPTLRSVAVT